MSLSNNNPSRIREFGHLFTGARRVVAIIRVDLAGVRFRPGMMLVPQCKWESSKVKQPSAVYPEFKEWADFVFSDIAVKTGLSLLYIFDLPDPAKRIGPWLYESGRQPRLVKALPNPFQRPLSEMLARMPPENWEDDAP